MIALALLVIGLGVIARLWWTSHPQILDRGDAPGNERAFWNQHSKLHLLGAGGLAFVVAVLDALTSSRDGFLAGLAVSLVLWTAVEIAQKFPRDKQGGFFEWSDLWWDGIGAFLGAWVGGFLGSLV